MSIKDVLNLEVDVVGQFVHLLDAGILVIADHGRALLNHFLILLPEVDVLHQGSIGVVDGVQDGVHLVEAIGGLVALQSLLIGGEISLGVDGAFIGRVVAEVLQGLLEVVVASVGTLTHVGDGEVVEDTPVTVDARALAHADAQAVGLRHHGHDDLVVIESQRVHGILGSLHVVGDYVVAHDFAILVGVADV